MQKSKKIIAVVKPGEGNQQLRKGLHCAIKLSWGCLGHAFCQFVTNPNPNGDSTSIVLYAQ